MPANECKHGITICSLCHYETEAEVRHLESIIERVHENLEATEDAYRRLVEEINILDVNCTASIRKAVLWAFLAGFVAAVIVINLMITYDL